jgi:1,4-dihydroxy-2-naphthoyl-CoA synthase
LQDGLEQAYVAATQTMVCNLLTDEVAEGIDAFIEKRKPRWPGA